MPGASKTTSTRAKSTTGATSKRRTTRARPTPPDRGDVVWLDFDPQVGHEQAKRRPALCLSPAVYNRAAGLALFCPITSQVKGYRFEVPFPPGGRVNGVVLADQVKSLDWQGRHAEPFATAPTIVLAETLKQVRKLL